MVDALKNHPFAVEAYFERSLMLTYAAPAEEIATLLPAPLTPDTFADRWAFVTVALVQTRGLRPKGLPAFLGQDFVLIGYRVFVRYVTSAGKRLRGLYILKSETNRRQMEWLGNLFTHYNYTTTDVALMQTGDALRAQSRQSDFDVHVALDADAGTLPPTSPFTDWAEARRYVGPLPFTFDYDAPRRRATPGRVLIVEGVREQWTPRPVRVLSAHIGWLATLPVSELRLANAFVIENVPYWWKKGRFDQWQG